MHKCSSNCISFAQASYLSLQFWMQFISLNVANFKMLITHFEGNVMAAVQNRKFD